MRPIATSRRAFLRSRAVMSESAKKSSDEKIIEEALKRFRYCEEAEQKNRNRALDDLRFSLGEQWPDDVRRARETDPNGARPCLTAASWP